MAPWDPPLGPQHCKHWRNYSSPCHHWVHSTVNTGGATVHLIITGSTVLQTLGELQFTLSSLGLQYYKHWGNYSSPYHHWVYSITNTGGTTVHLIITGSTALQTLGELKYTLSSLGPQHCKHWGNYSSPCHHWVHSTANTGGTKVHLVITRSTVLQTLGELQVTLSSLGLQYIGVQ